MKLKSFSLKLRLRLKKLIIDLKKTHLKDLRNTLFANVKKVPDIVHLKNIVLFSSVLSIVIISMFVNRFNILNSFFITEIPVVGGVYSHGVIGTIESINPLFAQGDAEEAAVSLIYSGLTRTVSGKQIPDLAETWTVSSDGLTYDFLLRHDISWHDGSVFTADDVVYTIQLIQNPDTRTSLYDVWNGVTVEKVGDYEVKFTLPNPYPKFLEVANQGILPVHLLKGIDAKNIKVAEFNMAPIGTGPYSFIRFDQAGTQTEVVFEANDSFAIGKPYISQINLVLYDSEDSLYEGLARRQISGTSEISINNLDSVKDLANLEINETYFPQYEVLCLNYNNTILANKDIRKALAAAVNRSEIISKVFNDEAMAVSAVLLPGLSGYDSSVSGIAYDVNAANTALDTAGWTRGENGVRQKEGVSLSFNFVYVDNSENNEVATILKEQLAAVGVELKLIAADESLISPNYIRPRNYDMILIGQNVGFDEDLYSFWHSSQKTNTGLNLSSFASDEVDNLLEQVRKSNDENYRSVRYREVQNVINEETPAIFLYSPLNFSAISRDVHVIEQTALSEASDVLNNIYVWYIETEKTR